VVLTKKGLSAIVAAAPGHAALVRRLFFEPLPDELVSPFTAALEHIQASLNLNASLPPVALYVHALHCGCSVSTVYSSAMAPSPTIATSKPETCGASLPGSTKLNAMRPSPVVWYAGPAATN
jgi:hypothetical protein